MVGVASCLTPPTIIQTIVVVFPWPFVTRLSHIVVKLMFTFRQKTLPKLDSPEPGQDGDMYS